MRASKLCRAGVNSAIWSHVVSKSRRWSFVLIKQDSPMQCCAGLALSPFRRQEETAEEVLPDAFLPKTSFPKPHQLPLLTCHGVPPPAHPSAAGPALSLTRAGCSPPAQRLAHPAGPLAAFHSPGGGTAGAGTRPGSGRRWQPRDAPASSGAGEAAPDMAVGAAEPHSLTGARPPPLPRLR